MTKKAKKYREVEKLVNKQILNGLDNGVALLKKVSCSKFDATVSIAVNLGVDPRKSDQMVRGSVSLPFGSGKIVKILVITKGEKLKEASEAGADYVGGEDLISKIKDENWLDFDKVIATPDMMGVVGKVAKILGPRGLMPNPKLGTVTFEIASSIKESKAGKAEYRAEKAGICHVPVGKISFENEKLVGNIKAVMEAIVRAKPATSKGTYVKKMTLSTTYSPGVPIDVVEFSK